MNLAAIGLLQKYPGLVNLQDMLSLKSNQLNITHLQRIAQALKVEIPFHDEILEALLGLLKGRDINEVADLIQSPESVGDLVVFFQGGYRGLVDMKSGEHEAYLPEATQLFIGA